MNRVTDVLVAKLCDLDADLGWAGAIARDVPQSQVALRPILSRDLLLKEYIDWTTKHGNGRNKQDWRFGQYLVNIYGYDIPGLFFVEEADKAYAALSQYLETVNVDQK